MSSKFDSKSLVFLLAMLVMSLIDLVRYFRLFNVALAGSIVYLISTVAVGGMYDGSYDWSVSLSFIVIGIYALVQVVIGVMDFVMSIEQRVKYPWTLVVSYIGAISWLGLIAAALVSVPTAILTGKGIFMISILIILNVPIALLFWLWAHNPEFNIEEFMDDDDLESSAERV